MTARRSGRRLPADALLSSRMTSTVVVSVGGSPASDEDDAFVHDLVRRHYDYTQSQVAWRILSGWKQNLRDFRKVMPVEYRRVLAQRAGASR